MRKRADVSLGRGGEGGGQERGEGVGGWGTRLTDILQERGEGMGGWGTRLTDIYSWCMAMGASAQVTAPQLEMPVDGEALLHMVMLYVTLVRQNHVCTISWDPSGP
jgi:hypothetical protein